MISFRNLTADEIECRVQQVSEKGLILLLYKNARCDMNILDETVGSENWQREHYTCKDNLFCRVGINSCFYDATSAKEWIWKSDCGSESNTEKEKGEASDSFKRACVNWGIGRELYTAPFIFIPSSNENYRTFTKNGKTATNDKFIIEKIAISENKKITGIAIKNATLNKRVYVWKAENGA